MTKHVKYLALKTSVTRWRVGDVQKRGITRTSRYIRETGNHSGAKAYNSSERQQQCVSAAKTGRTITKIHPR